MTRRSRFPLGLLAVTVVTMLGSVDSAAAESLADTVSSPAASASRTTAPGTDWRNTTYTLPCGGRSTRPLTVTVRNGHGLAPGDSRSTGGYDISVAAVARGDLTRDGRPETVVLLFCQPWLANYLLRDVLVFTGSRTLLGHLPVLEPVRGASRPEYRGRFRVSHGRLFTGVGYYAPDECHVCGPSLYATLAWHWDGRRFATRTPVGASR